ncbi:ATP-binding protein [Bauldia sp.]|uniref:HAMP domain-containing sensor histidine kinase n=1 Tax=Bauldia sp. TaxID=2575872 RepID=UPI003BAC53FB
MKRLYRKIYFTIIGSLVLVMVVAAAVWHSGADETAGDAAYDLAADIILTALPPAGAPTPDQAEALAMLSERLDADLALYDPQRRLIATTGTGFAPRIWDDDDEGWAGSERGPAFAFMLDDARWVVVDLGGDERRPLGTLLLFLGAIAVAVGISAYPVARGLTRRLERLKAGVDTLGSGDLAARVKVEGKDEVAHLAESFNRAAEQIEKLVEANRMMLANASHELRTPLSRIRLGLDLLEKRPDAKLKAELHGDIAELDRLIDEILLASRLDATQTLAASEEVDLQALCAEECARFDDCELLGDPVIVDGDPRLLRRMIRNLLENAQRHGRPPIKLALRSVDDGATVTVLDSGDGVPETERERIFAPFHRLNRDRPGAGLGLSLVRQIARLHGGDVQVWRDEALGLNGFRVDLRRA